MRNKYNIKLLVVPNNQKLWFIKNSSILNQEIENSELICFNMLLNNILGINERFVNYNNSTTNGLIDDIFENYILHNDKTQFILDLLICILEDCKDLEYYELANNINLIIHKSSEMINFYDIETA